MDQPGEGGVDLLGEHLGVPLHGEDLGTALEFEGLDDAVVVVPVTITPVPRRATAWWWRLLVAIAGP